ncbi:MAG: bifunctional precorrin-2 dehydrogenase/sirohydrochlorin ferrochelatase [Hydrogenobacter thermophilus]|nr:bifunctional precorrin-2 dehydrogenase/sirohydrochlorin ferrochelatase [Hydrogenobacter thermophilus]
MPHFPAFISLEGKKVVVVGGGVVAERKIEKLLPFKPSIRVISPAFTAGIEKLRREGKVSVVKRKFMLPDIRDAFMVIVAVDNIKLQKRIYEYCKKRRILCNAVDSPDFCTFIFPALVIRGDIVIGISTSGKVPALSRSLREYVQKALPENLEQVKEKLETMRRNIPKGEERQRLMVKLSRRFLNL